MAAAAGTELVEHLARLLRLYTPVNHHRSTRDMREPYKSHRMATASKSTPSARLRRRDPACENSQWAERTPPVTSMSIPPARMWPPQLTELHLARLIRLCAAAQCHGSTAESQDESTRATGQLTRAYKGRSGVQLKASSVREAPLPYPCLVVGRDHSSCTFL